MNALNSNPAGPSKPEEYRELQTLLAGVVAKLSTFTNEDNSLDKQGIGLRVPSRDPEEAKLTALARRLYEDRRQRQTLFPDAIQGEPGWDLLLDLFVSRHHDHRVSIKSGCIASRSPATTALRYIQTLEKNGYLQKEADPDDGRRVYIKLTDFGNRQVEIYLRALLESSRPLP